MNTFIIYAIAAPFNAFICCAFITFFMRKINISAEARAVITFIVYAFLAFAMTAQGEGIFNIDFMTFNWTLFLLYITSGACVTFALYMFINRATIGAKIEAKKAAKKNNKGN